MAKRRIFQIAKELNISHTEILSFLEGKGIEVASHMAPIEEDIYNIVLSEFHKDKESVETSFGTYEAYKVSRKFNDESDRSQVFWLAPDLDYSVIKIYDKNDREVEIKIKDFQETG